MNRDMRVASHNGSTSTDNFGLAASITLSVKSSTLVVTINSKNKWTTKPKSGRKTIP